MSQPPALCPTPLNAASGISFDHSRCPLGYTTHLEPEIWRYPAKFRAGEQLGPAEKPRLWLRWGRLHRGTGAQDLGTRLRSKALGSRQSKRSELY
jgi:hypothetical protein